MSAKHIITIFGATGAQGGSVVKAILGDAIMSKSWTVRGVTRDTTKPSAKALESLGVETVAADLNDPESVKVAIKGAYAVFAVTNYWERGLAEAEFAQGKTMADAAKKAGVRHFIWSSLVNVTELSKGALPLVSHFDSKADVEKYIRSIGLPASFFLPGFYMSNLPGGMFRQSPPDNAWALSLPIPASSPVPLLDTAEDTGKFVKAMLLNRELVLGKHVLGATKYYTLEELVTEFKVAFPEAGKTAKYNELPHDVFKNALTTKGRSEHAAEEVLQNMRLLNEFGYYGGASLDHSLAILGEKPTTWTEFMKKAPAFAELK